jgi:hypothetical protein
VKSPRATRFAPSYVRDVVRATALGIGAGEETEKIAVLAPKVA